MEFEIKEDSLLHTRYNPDLFSFMPENAERVLELGCNNGAFGLAYKQTHPQTVYWGIEIDEAAAHIAESRLDGIVCGDCENPDVVRRAAGEKPVDCIVYGDVLEHLRDPWSALRMHASHLRENGIILASIPNVQHWTVLLNLLHGNWDYRDSGILDRTHFRFFTHKTVRELFQQAGLQILDLRARRPAQDEFPHFFEAIRPTLLRLGIHEQSFAATASVVQYVVKASKNPISDRS